MFVVAGATGNTGGAVARSLLERRFPVRAIVRERDKGGDWEGRGAEICVADLADAASLSSAFTGAQAAYVLNPPAYASDDLFARAEAIAAAVETAAVRSGLPRLVVLSSIGAHRKSGTGNILTNRLFEERLSKLGDRVVFLRPAYFLENWGWVAGAASRDGVLPSFLAPLDRRIPMVSTADIGRAAADLLTGQGARGRILELAGPAPCSPADVAEAFGRALGRSVLPVAVPEADWPASLAGSGFSSRTIEAWVELFRAFNSGWIAFEGGERASLRGRTPLEEAVGALLGRSGAGRSAG